jgi:hypothetical protein
MTLWCSVQSTVILHSKSVQDALSCVESDAEAMVTLHEPRRYVRNRVMAQDGDSEFQSDGIQRLGKNLITA